MKAFVILGHLYVLPPCEGMDQDNCYFEAEMSPYHTSYIITVDEIVHFANILEFPS